MNEPSKHIEQLAREIFSLAEQILSKPPSHSSVSVDTLARSIKSCAAQIVGELILVGEKS